MKRYTRFASARALGPINQPTQRVPARTPFTDPIDTGIGDLVAKVSKHPRIKVYLNSTIAETSGAPGKFSTQIATESGATTTEEVGAIVQSTGFTSYDINKLPELGGGKSANVVDQAGLGAVFVGIDFLIVASERRGCVVVWRIGCRALASSPRHGLSPSENELQR